jgi:integrase
MEKTLSEFIEKIQLSKNKEIAQSSKNIYKSIAKIFYPFEKLTKVKIDKQLKNLSPSTHNLYRIVLIYLARFEYIPLEIIQHIKRKKAQPRYTSKSQLITREEVQQLIEINPSLLMKSFYSLLYEAGIRKDEILKIQINDFYKVTRKDKTVYYELLVHGKGNKTRVIPILESLSYLLPYLASRGNHEGQIWQHTVKSKPLKYTTIKDRLRADLKKCGITKKITMHTFRHSRATELSTKLTASVLQKFFGWESQKQILTYVHLAGEDLRKEINSFYGIETKEERVVITVCPTCKLPIKETLESCPQCNTSFKKEIKISGVSSETEENILKTLINLITIAEENKIDLATLLERTLLQKIKEEYSKEKEESSKEV